MRLASSPPPRRRGMRRVLLHQPDRRVRHALAHQPQQRLHRDRVPPAVHGICGNYFLNRDRGVEVMMNQPPSAPMIFAAFERAGVDVAVVTGQGQAAPLLGDGLRLGVCSSTHFPVGRSGRRLGRLTHTGPTSTHHHGRAHASGAPVPCIPRSIDATLPPGCLLAPARMAGRHSP